MGGGLHHCGESGGLVGVDCVWDAAGGGQSRRGGKGNGCAQACQGMRGRASPVCECACGARRAAADAIRRPRTAPATVPPCTPPPPARAVTLQVAPDWRQAADKLKEYGYYDPLYVS